jgi:hypothetical protein
MEEHKKLKEALEKNQDTVLLCNCEVEYDGRAKTYLSQGDRIIIIKSDKALIIHQPTGNNPVNYMKPGTNHTLTTENDSTVVNSYNDKEYMKIIINNIHSFHSHKLEDTEKIKIAGTEADMNEHILQNPSLIHSNFKPLSLEEHTKYGFIDVFGYINNELTVVECKRFTADLSAVSQLRRYVEKIKKSKGLTSVKGIIASPSITPNALKMLTDFGYSHIQVNPPIRHEKFYEKQKKLF